VCRRSGLEKRRRCGWLGFGEDLGAAPVWARNGVALTTCPKPYITPASEALIEEFLVRRKLGFDGELTGRQADAFVILASAVEQERNDGQHHTR
jgi:hypothetical protein